MNKKGFTLIELLATIIILGVIGLIVYPTLNKVISGNKEKAFQKQVEEVERIASHWVANNSNEVYYDDNKSKYLYLSELYETGFIDRETVFNPKTNEEMKGCVVITWKSDINQHTYTYDEECTPTESPVITMTVDNNIINSKGWAKENFYVKVVGEYLTSYNYCVSETDCTPNTTVTGTSGSIYITKEGINKVCVEGINKTGKTETKCESYKLDKTLPVIGNILVSGTMGLNNWYVSNVTVSKTESSDTLSGIESNELSPSITNITTDTTGTVYTLTAKDNAGNIATRSYSFKIDKTAPTAGTANIAGTLGSNNWYTSNVTITPVNGSDTTSGHSSTTSNISSITSNTSGSGVIITTKDQAGNSSTKTYTVKVDKNAPTLTAKDGVVEIKEGDSNPVSNYFNTPTYSISGGSLSCSPANTSSLAVGTQTVSCTATGWNGVSRSVTKTITIIEGLLTILKKTFSSGNTVGLLNDGSNYYYKGTNSEVANNFVWYEGHLWRVIQINSDDTITMITQQPITAIQPASSTWTTQSAYESSYINTWLNEVFYNSISDKSKIRQNSFNVGIYTNVSEITTTQYVGLLNSDQYTKAGFINSFLDIKNYFWLGNRYNSLYNSLVWSDGHVSDRDSYYAFGVRPVIKISDLSIVSGDGTLSNPFRESSKSTNTSNVKVGEYIKVPAKCGTCGNYGSCLFRVVSKDNDSIKVILNGLLPTTSGFGETTTFSTSSTIYTPLTNFANVIGTEYIYRGDKTFNIGKYPHIAATGNGQNYTIVGSQTISSNVGLPVVGEMFSGNDIDATTSFWVMNAHVDGYGSSNVRIVNYGGSLGWNNPTYSLGVRPIIFLKSNLSFIEGAGTAEWPYSFSTSSSMC